LIGTVTTCEHEAQHKHGDQGLDPHIWLSPGLVKIQPQFSSRSAKLVAREIEGQVAHADPLAEDWMTNLEAVAATFQGALK
jgi:ABC-type Zn uptake system ZnuABC Zn-binding protein ZnuA